MCDPAFKDNKESLPLIYLPKLSDILYGTRITLLDIILPAHLQVLTIAHNASIVSAVVYIVRSDSEDNNDG